MSAERAARCAAPHEGEAVIRYAAAEQIVEMDNGRGETFRICKHCLVATLRQLGVIGERSRS